MAKHHGGLVARVLACGLRLLSVAALAVVGLAAMAAPASAQTTLTACATLTTGNYVLGKDIKATGSCFIVNDDNVAIDFKGHTLTGDGTGDGISGTGDYFAFTRGKIKGFVDGIDMDSCCGAISNMNVSKNSGTGIDIEHCCSTVSNVTTNDNGGDGLDVLDCCSTISWAVSLRNKGVGILATDCCGGVSNSVARDNGGTGIEANGCCWGVSKVTSTGNGGDGISGTDSDTGVTDSKANKNGGTGINLAISGEDYEIVNDTANGNATGAAVNCSSVVLGLKATGNSTANLTEVGTTCTNLRNKVE